MDGSAGDVDYEKLSSTYPHYRVPEPAIMAMIEHSLGDAKTVLNVGAGAGSYEPWETRTVTAVEPSAAMRAKRLPPLSQAVDAVAQALPFADGTFDAAMATFSVHQWRAELELGLSEMMRVSSKTVVLLTFDPETLAKFWIAEYTGEMLTVEAGRRFPTMARLQDILGRHGASVVEVIPIPIPLNCTDGFIEAYYGRPEMYLDEAVRKAQSSWSFFSKERQTGYVNKLRSDLESGLWDKKYGHLRSLKEYQGSVRLVVARKFSNSGVAVGSV
ncbi:hypothetical protein HDU93_000681 [Gonapodya sp. JEL0774]|nr:hypothetical protein HDU93_000681 [Gonapodya sp. JEL0774]